MRAKSPLRPGPDGMPREYTNRKSTRHRISHGAAVGDMIMFAILVILFAFWAVVVVYLVTLWSRHRRRDQP